jgi:N-methylhydantoinase A/oxoprolinase/acetone carboxylase beta subunit
VGTSFLAGIDTGGTYTDAVLVDAATGRVAAAAKALTTRGNLSLGVIEALERVIAVAGADAAANVRLVAISTTLATNAVVEGHGSPIAILLAGFDAEMVARSKLVETFPQLPVEVITGGHDHNGDELAPLDEHAVEAVVRRHRDAVAAFAVASRFAVRNAAHEHRVRAIIEREAPGKPVTLSTELSSDLDAPRRALTAALNARLLSRIADLIASVDLARKRLGIDAPLMITRGDGSLARAETVALRPIETILSGPAASLIGAAKLTGLADFILSDIGGTTTDLAILKDGRPTITAKGAEVGGWRTMVNAIDVKTIGLGGDSAVSLTPAGRIVIGPERAVPLSLIASRFPNVIPDLTAELDETEGVSQHGRFVMLPLGSEGKAAPAAALSDRERQIMERIGVEPKPYGRLAISTSAARVLAGLARKGLVQIACFTPSDAAHVLGLQANWNREAALLGARLLYRAQAMRAPDLAGAEAISREVWRETVRLSGHAVLAAALDQPVARTGKPDPLLDAIADGRGRIGLVKLSAVPQTPVVAVGGPAKVFYDEVAKRLACEVVYPGHFDVANAVGAATGAVVGRAVAEVSGDGSGLFLVYTGGSVARFTSGASALAHAEETVRAQAQAQAKAMGAGAIDVAVKRDVTMLPDSVNDDGVSHARVEAEAIGQASFGGEAPAAS